MHPCPNPHNAGHPETLRYTRVLKNINTRQTVTSWRTDIGLSFWTLGVNSRLRNRSRRRQAPRGTWGTSCCVGTTRPNMFRERCVCTLRVAHLRECPQCKSDTCNAGLWGSSTCARPNRSGARSGRALGCWETRIES